MSALHPSRLLGVDVDADRRTIKRAYAAKLKAIDVDADPAAFIALRAAMEQMLRGVMWREHFAEQEALGEGDSDEEGDEHEAFPAETVAEPVPVPVVPDPIVIEIDADAPLHAVAPVTEIKPDPDAVAFDALNAEMDTLYGLLFSDEDAATIGWQIDLAWQQIVRNPITERIDVLDRMDHWFADVIMRTLPRSDPLVWPAIQFFDWAKDEQHWNGNPDVAAILRRQRDLDFLHTLSRPDNPLSAPFRTLQKMPDEASKAERVGGEAGIRTLLREIRFNHPTAEWNFDEARIAAWIDHLEAPRKTLVGTREQESVFVDKPTGSDASHGGWSWLMALGMLFAPYIACWFLLKKGTPTWLRIVGFGWALLAVIMIATGDSDQKQSNGLPTPVPVITTTANEPLDQRIERKLEGLEQANPNFRFVRERNPDLYMEMRAAVHERESGKFDDDMMMTRISGAIDAAYVRMLPEASNALLVEHFRLRQLRLAALSRLDPRACADENRDVDATKLPPSYQKRLQWFIMAVVSKSTFGSATGGGKPIDIEAIFRKAAQSIGVTPAQMDQRLSGKADPKAACAAKMALLNTIAAEPQERIAHYVRSGLKAAAARKKQ